MALDKVLKIYDENGNPVDYDILASDVKFLPDGKDLPTKLTEMEDAIEDAAEGGGYTPPQGGIPKTDLAPSVQTSLGLADTALQPADKTQLQNAINSLQSALDTLIGSGNVQGAIDTFNEVKAFLDGIDTDDPTLANQLQSLSSAISALQTALAGKISGIRANGASTTLPVDQNGIVELPPAGSTISPATAAPSMDGTASVGSSAKYAREDHVHPHDSTKLSKSDVSVETQEDGTFNMNVKDDTYTINLNHTHENMAKIVKCTEATRPQTLANDTIYVQVDNLTTPTEIESLWLFGLEFTGGGGAAPGVPYLSSPDANISMGDSENGSVTKAIRVKGRFLTQALSATLTGTGYAFDTTQPTGVTRNSNTSLTITADAAKAGVDISVVYTGTEFSATGALAITSSSPDSIDVESTLLANELDTDGLVAHWDAADAPSSGAWVDRINSMKLNLGGTAAHESGGYRLNNLSAPKNAWLYLDPSETTKMNTEIDKEFVCIVDCEVKFSAESKNAMLIDFGSLGTPLSGLALNAKVNQAGTLACTAKNGSSTITAQANNVQIPAFTLDTYVPIRLKCGISIASNGTQVISARIGTASAYSWNAPAITINFQGCSGPDNPNYAFGAGIVYMSGSSVNAYAGSYLVDVVYKSIIIYNKYI